MDSFINEDFLLTTHISRQLYHEIAENLPVIDFHNHLDPQKLAENHKFADLAELWIHTDPYKHRVMRIAGIDEEMITGIGISGKERYDTWASIFPRTLGNPLFHWSCMELKRFFGIDEILNRENAGKIWKVCNDILRQPGWGMLDILKRCRVEMLCTSDDLLADFTLHRQASLQPQNIIVKPSLRADSVISFTTPSFRDFVSQLAELSGIKIKCLEDYLNAIDIRLNLFSDAGCEYADHSLDAGFRFVPVLSGEASSLFGKLLQTGEISSVETVKLQSYILLFMGRCYARRNWNMQLHIGAKRDTNTRLRTRLGPAGGYAAIGSACDVNSLVCFLDTLNEEDSLPRTILYTLNPADNAVFATLTGSYSGSGILGKLQFGPAWWYNDHLEGMTQQLQSLSSYGLLSCFVGMTTDSRSVLSFSRHEYFRRVLCRFIGEKVVSGEFPSDMTLLGDIVKDICYRNCKNWRK